ncbi:MAG: amino acid adenylation domain-containing protein [Bryobacteraceae bacterium]
MTKLDPGRRPLWTGFLDSARNFPNRPAIQIEGREVTYQELAKKALRLAATLQDFNLGEESFTAVFAYRSETSFAAVLGALLAGGGYVPLNRTFPVERTRLMLERSWCRSIVVDAESEKQLEQILRGITTPLLLLCPDREEVTELAARFPEHRFLSSADFSEAEQWRAIDHSSDSIAYLLFTSGSTGQPKGVMVTHANVVHYVDYITKRYAFTSDDRFSQTFDLTFDLSVHDLFVAWQAGACICCPTRKQSFKPSDFIKAAELSVWFSVPSTALFMRRLGVLKPNMYPGLRLSLFCGEALPMEIAREWAAAAPNSVIENLYGPTELTIACTAYRWNDGTSPAESEQGVVPIGEPFDGMEALIVDDEFQEVEDSQAGELVMTGPQMCLGYWQDDEKTKQAFVAVPGKEGKVYYRTGDRVRRRQNGFLNYLGRLDSQIKILGHRVELGEVESAVRETSGLEGVVALGWPLTERGADAIEVFLETSAFDTAQLQEQLRSRLPTYMVPRNIRLLSSFPLNSNGKFDRVALLQLLKSGDAVAAMARGG